MNSFTGKGSGPLLWRGLGEVTQTRLGFQAFNRTTIILFMRCAAVDGRRFYQICGTGLRCQVWAMQ